MPYTVQQTQIKALELQVSRVKAIILAAGKGLRLRPLTGGVSKPMVEVAGCPILEHNVRLLASHNIKEIIINLHYKPDVIMRYFENGKKWGVKIQYSYEPEIMGTAGAVKFAEGLLGTTFIVFYGDNLTNLDITNLIRYHRSRSGIGTIAVFHRQDVGSSGVVDFDENGCMTGFIEKPCPRDFLSNWVNAGILILEREILDFIPEDVKCDFGKDIIPSLLKEGKRLYAYPMSEALWWIDTPDDLERIRELERRGGLALP